MTLPRPTALVTLLALLAIPAPAAAQAPRPIDEVRKVLDAQVAAWNRGDLDGFCAAYATDAAYASPDDGLVKGRDAICDRYRAKYGSGAPMGTLSVELREWRTARWGAMRGKAYTASVIAEWRLEREGAEPAKGWTLLVLERAGRSDWQVVQDLSF